MPVSIALKRSARIQRGLAWPSGPCARMTRTTTMMISENHSWSAWNMLHAESFGPRCSQDTEKSEAGDLIPKLPAMSPRLQPSHSRRSSKRRRHRMTQVKSSLKYGEKIAAASKSDTRWPEKWQIKSRKCSI